jgi:predicted nicotinamide N-methyase
MSQNSLHSKQRRFTGAVFSYEIHGRTLTFGNHIIQVETLVDFSKAIDDMFAYLQQSNQTEILAKYCPYFGEIWPASIALSEYIATLNIDWSQVRAIELGCGLAIPSILMAKLGARSVVASDCHPDVGAFLRESIKQNQVDSLNYLEVDWTTGPLPDEKFDLVVASDVVYDAHLPRVLADAMTKLASPGATILLTDPGRAYLQDFEVAMRAKGVNPTTEIIRIENSEYPSKDVFLIRAQM